MEINITKFFLEACPKDYSASVAEIGNNAGAYTWQAAKDDSQDYMMLDTEEKQQAFRDYAGKFGAWSDEEINNWNQVELNALFIQFISSEMREHGLSVESDWEEYEESEGAGCLFKGTDGQYYFYVGD